MSTGKRLAKRSIIGTRVCAPGLDGKYYSGVIQAVKTAEEESRYSVRFDAGASCEYREHELVGPGFRSVAGLTLQPGQKVFLTYNGREVRGIVKSHQQQLDELMVAIEPPGQEKLEVRKRLEEIRLLESRKSARLQDQDTDFARLADMAGDRRRTVSGSIDVPVGTGSRKRRPSYSQEDLDFMDECTAALVLMSLSCSPHSPRLTGASPSPASPLSWRSATPSPPLSDADSTTAFWTTLVADEGIVMDDFTDDLPKRKKARGSAEPYVLHNDSDSDASKGSRMVFQCTWPGCLAITTTCSAIESHVRQLHLGRPRQTADGDDFSDHEEEFYYTEVELGLHTSSPPTMSHRDMARPPHEDPEYQKQLKNGPINIPNGSLSWPSSSSSLNSPQKHLKLSPRSGTTLSVSAPNKLLPGSPTRKLRGDTKKCRKVYGMEHRELWCTQCKWKKACTRFGD